MFVPLISLVAFALLFSACAKPAPVVNVAPSPTATPAVELPSGQFIASDMDWAATQSGLSPLKATNVGPGDAEVRVWYGFGLSGLDALVIKRTNNEWTAFHLKADDYTPHYKKRIARIKLDAPKSGWERCWQQLSDAGILTLPSGTEGPDPDAEGFYVETKVDGSYRNYVYHSPEYSDTPNAKRMLTIGDIISDEFGLKRFHVTKPLQSSTMPNKSLDASRGSVFRMKLL